MKVETIPMGFISIDFIAIKLISNVKIYLGDNRE